MNLRPSSHLTPGAVFVLAALAVAGLVVADTAYRSKPEPAKRPAETIHCRGNHDIVLDNRFIETAGTAIEFVGNCDLRIVGSHIVAGETAVRSASNSDIVIVDSFLHGESAVLDIEGNADVFVEGSTLRGRHRIDGNGGLIDRGGNRFETSEPVPRRLTDADPIVCGEHERVEIRGRAITTDGDAIVATGFCQIVVSDSLVVASGAAIRVSENASVQVRNTTIDGATDALVVEGDGRVDLAGSNLFGRITASDPRRQLRYGGGNAVGR